MKNLLMTLLILGALTTPAHAGSPNPKDFPVRGSASFGDAGSFYGDLAPYGEWLEMDAGFYAWRPTHVRYGWRPYMFGHWAWTDYGWYWLSDEPFGWAVFHYGRWYNDDYYGWIWIPDRTWGPSWVEWRYNDDYIGWAPLPPYASFSFHAGIRFTMRWFAPYHYWSFVRYRHFGSPHVTRELVPIEHTRRLIGSTRTGGRYDVDGDRIINRGIDKGIVERRGGNTRIARTEVRETNNIGERIVRGRNEDRIDVYRPDRSGTGRTPERIEARRLDRGSSLDLQKIERPPRESGRTFEPREPDRGRTVTREGNEPPPERIQRPETPPRREEPVQQPRIERRNQLPQGPTVERRELQSRKADRAPSLRREQSPQQQERRVVIPERPQREQRHETPAPRTRVEPQPAPGKKEERPRGSEQNRREGGRRRD
ncbi:MAG: hypothetical protein NTU47_06010 [Ignavibacteriales bacterium]|nr:hypothetical protein [Ignavibacteriales bacterium]